VLQSPPDLLLSDIAMPEENGRDLIRRERYGSPGALRLPAKPTDPAVLVQAIASLVKEGKAQVS
jgi:CheY-like chemotaxis protein